MCITARRTGDGVRKIGNTRGPPHGVLIVAAPVRAAQRPNDHSR